MKKQAMLKTAIGLLAAVIIFSGCEKRISETINSDDSNRTETAVSQTQALETPPVETTTIQQAPEPIPAANAVDFTVTDLDGNKISLSDYRGKNVMVIFWATWCPPCKAEIPDLIELRKKYSQDELAMIAISVEDERIVKSFVEANKNMNYTIATARSYESLPRPFSNVQAIPTAYYVDKTGEVKFTTVGLMALNQIEAYVKKLE